MHYPPDAVKASVYPQPTGLDSVASLTPTTIIGGSFVGKPNPEKPRSACFWVKTIGDAIQFEITPDADVDRSLEAIVAFTKHAGIGLNYTVIIRPRA